jgi:hypothetical protein
VDQHQQKSEKLDPDPHSSDADPKPWYEQGCRIKIVKFTGIEPLCSIAQEVCMTD